MFDFYITPDEYEIAASNNIHPKTLEARIREHGWDKQRAITKPARKLSEKIPQWVVDQAETNGISYETLRNRVHRYKWSYERACTEPLQNRSKQAKRMGKRNKKYPQELLDLAASNGVPYNTFATRIRKLKWDMHKAATTPVMSKSDIGLLTKDKREIVFGRKLNPNVSSR